jgi:hypothetical protein
MKAENESALEPGVLTEELAREVAAAAESRVSTVVVTLLSAILLLWALGLLLRGITRLSARLGIERGRRLWRFAHLFQLAVLLLVTSGLVQSMARIAPVWVAFVIAFVLIPIAVWASGTVHDLVGGLVAQLRLRLAEADYVRIGDASGVLTRIGLTHVELRDEAGTLHRLPNRVLTSQAVELAAQRRAVPLDVVLLTSRALSADEAAELADITVTSAYRAPGTPLQLERLSNPDRVRVRLSVWSQAAAGPMRRTLERTLSKLLR